MTAAEAQVRANGVTLYCQTAGDGHRLVLVHGGFADRNSWHAVARTCAA